MLKTDKQFNIRFVANTNEKREKGLMFADPLDDDEVAFFVFPTSNRYAFWNKNVPFGLSLAFVSEHGEIVDIADMDADSPKRVEPKSDNVKYVIEAKRGVFNKFGIKKGDIVKYTENNKLNVIPK
jgi:uncharacterized membrane protein (UPF0127 family)